MDQKNCFEKEARDNARLAKLQEEEIESLQQQADELEMERGHMQHVLDETKKKLKQSQTDVLDKIEELEAIKAEYTNLRQETADKDDQLLEEQEKNNIQTEHNERLSA